MDPQLLEIAQGCLSAAFDGTRDFTTIVRTLIATGFEGYDVDYRRGTFTYFLPSGASAQLAMPPTEGGVAAERVVYFGRTAETHVEHFPK